MKKNLIHLLGGLSLSFFIYFAANLDLKTAVFIGLGSAVLYRISLKNKSNLDS